MEAWEEEQAALIEAAETEEGEPSPGATTKTLWCCAMLCSSNAPKSSVSAGSTTQVDSPSDKDGVTLPSSPGSGCRV